MRPTQWRTSTHLIVGVGVLAIVAAVVAATALFSASGRGASGPQVPPPPPAVTAKPSIVPVAVTVPVPTKSALAATLAAVVADPNLGKLGGRVTDAMTAKELWQQQDDVPMQPALIWRLLDEPIGTEQRHTQGLPTSEDPSAGPP